MMANTVFYVIKVDYSLGYPEVEISQVTNRNKSDILEYLACKKDRLNVEYIVAERVAKLDRLSSEIEPLNF